MFSKKSQDTVLRHNDRINDISFRADGKELAVSTFRGESYIWDPETEQVKGLIDTSKDLKGGRSKFDHQEAKNKGNLKSFKRIRYFPDGEYIIGGGDGKNVCMYDVRHRTMIRRVAITNSRSLDGMQTLLSSRNVKDGINLDLLDEQMAREETRKKGDINFMERKKEELDRVAAASREADTFAANNAALRAKKSTGRNQAEQREERAAAGRRESELLTWTSSQLERLEQLTPKLEKQTKRRRAQPASAVAVPTGEKGDADALQTRLQMMADRIKAIMDAL